MQFDVFVLNIDGASQMFSMAAGWYEKRKKEWSSSPVKPEKESVIKSQDLEESTNDDDHFVEISMEK
jgi:hypothetical protein